MVCDFGQDNTDLGVIEDTYEIPLFYVPGTGGHNNFDRIHQENEHGNVFSLNSRNEVHAQSKIEETFKKTVKKVAKNVGAILGLYTSSDGSKTYSRLCGTAFVVSPTRIVTTVDTIEKTITKRENGDEIMYINPKFFFTTKVDVSLGKEIRSDLKSKHLLPLQVLSQRVDSAVVFLAFDGTAHPVKSYCLPTLPTEEDGYVMIGYSDDFDFETFSQSYAFYHLDSERKRDLYNLLCRLYCRPQTKVATKGSRTEKIEGGYVVSHNCPSVPGMNGGPLIQCNAVSSGESCFFVGVNGGGFTGLEGTKTVFVTEPAFFINYLEQVGSQFLNENKNSLSCFFQYHARR